MDYHDRLLLDALEVNGVWGTEYPVGGHYAFVDSGYAMMAKDVRRVADQYVSGENVGPHPGLVPAVLWAAVPISKVALVDFCEYAGRGVSEARQFGRELAAAHEQAARHIAPITESQWDTLHGFYNRVAGLYPFEGADALMIRHGMVAWGLTVPRVWPWFANRHDVKYLSEVPGMFGVIGEWGVAPTIQTKRAPAYVESDRRFWLAIAGLGDDYPEMQAGVAEFLEDVERRLKKMGGADVEITDPPQFTGGE